MDTRLNSPLPLLLLLLFSAFHSICAQFSINALSSSSHSAAAAQHPHPHPGAAQEQSQQSSNPYPRIKIGGPLGQLIPNGFQLGAGLGSVINQLIGQTSSDSPSSSSSSSSQVPFGALPSASSLSQSLRNPFSNVNIGGATSSSGGGGGQYGGYGAGGQHSLAQAMGQQLAQLYGIGGGGGAQSSGVPSVGALSKYASQALNGALYTSSGGAGKSSYASLFGPHLALSSSSSGGHSNDAMPSFGQHSDQESALFGSASSPSHSARLPLHSMHSLTPFQALTAQHNSGQFGSSSLAGSMNSDFLSAHELTGIPSFD